MNAERFSRLKPGSHLINISRAALIDHDALKEQLDSGQIARASLDVVSPEPLPDEHWLYQHPSVQLSPHIAWNGPRSHERMSQAFLDNLRRWCAGGSLQGVIDTCVGY
jgi:phosphoglycerate dehydrogenase-like enzyme